MSCDGCKYTGSGTTTTATLAPVTFSNQVFDNAGNPYINSPPSTDMYCDANGRRRIAVKAVWGSPTAATTCKVFLYLNGTQIDYHEQAFAAGSTPINLLTDVYASFTSGDILTVSVWQNSGAGLGFTVSCSVVLEECECGSATALTSAKGAAR